MTSIAIYQAATLTMHSIAKEGHQVEADSTYAEFVPLHGTKKAKKVPVRRHLLLARYTNYSYDCCLLN